ncbi:MAG TPA: ribonuclease HII [Candidatus Saccharimonadales bacterium]
MTDLDQELIDKFNKPMIIGADECGYGALAGILTICAVKAPSGWNLDGLNDSKKLSAKKREIMRDQLLKLAEQGVIQYAIASRSNVEIDASGVASALRSCYAEVYKKLYDPDCLLIADGNLKFDELAAEGYTVESVIKADAKFPTVMAASIIGKVFRDEIMHQLHNTYPNYGWDHNVGYGAQDHLEAIKMYGPCPLHRMSYAPMKNMKIVNPKQLILKL